MKKLSILLSVVLIFSIIMGNVVSGNDTITENTKTIDGFVYHDKK